jgi:hypothetical protein
VASERDNDAEPETAAELLEELPCREGDLPPMDFSTFIVSLRASAMLHLGSGREGGSEQSIDLALARQEIDLLGVLEMKTRGNLTGEEERLLSQILFDLRTRYVAVCDRKRSQA